MSSTSRWRPDASPDAVILAVSKCLTATLDESEWRELALRTGTRERIGNHPRLLRSLKWGDPDYDGNVMEVVPWVLGEQRGPHIHQPLAHRFPNLDVVSDFAQVPDWLEKHEPTLFAEVCTPNEQDATLPDGTVLDAAEAAAARFEVAAMRRQVDRIRRDYASDPEALVGAAKELIESVCKTILGLTGAASRTSEDVPALVKKTLRHLGLSPNAVSDGDDSSELKALRRIMGGLSSVLLGANELRNARGTGHGRSNAPIIDEALARMTAGMVLSAVVYLCEKYEQSIEAGAEAPLLVSPPAAEAGEPAYELNVHVEVGAVVEHPTFGRGTVIALRGDGKDAQAQVDFGGEKPKWLMLSFAPLVIDPPVF